MLRRWRTKDVMKHDVNMSATVLFWYIIHLKVSLIWKRYCCVLVQYKYKEISVYCYNTNTNCFVLSQHKEILSVYCCNTDTTNTLQNRTFRRTTNVHTGTDNTYTRIGTIVTNSTCLHSVCKLNLLHEDKCIFINSDI